MARAGASLRKIPRQHPFCEAAGKRPAVLPLLASQFLAVRQRHGDARFRIDQEFVLRQEAGEQHPVPVLVGHLVSESVDRLDAGLQIAAVPELAPVRPQPAPQVLLRRGHRRVGAAGADREHGECVAGPGLARPPRCLDRRGKSVAKSRIQRMVHERSPEFIQLKECTACLRGVLAHTTDEFVHLENAVEYHIEMTKAQKENRRSLAGCRFLCRCCIVRHADHHTHRIVCFAFHFSTKNVNVRSAHGLSSKLELNEVCRIANSYRPVDLPAIDNVRASMRQLEVSD